MTNGIEIIPTGTVKWGDVRAKINHNIGNGLGSVAHLCLYGGRGDGELASAEKNSQALMEAASSLVAGGTILLGPGTYYFSPVSGYDVGLFNNIVINGSGSGATVIDIIPDGYYTSNSAFLNGLTGNVCLSNLHIINDNFTIAEHQAFMFFEGANFTAINCLFTCCYRPFKIYGDMIETVKIWNCRFVPGKQPYADPVVSVNCSGAESSFLWVESSRFDGFKSEGTPHYFATIDASVQRSIINNNYIIGYAYSGCINMEDCRPGEIQVTNNQIDMSSGGNDGGTMKSGINLAGSVGIGHALVQGNSVKGNATIESFGVHISFGSAEDGNVTICDNKIYDVEYGVIDNTDCGIGKAFIYGNNIEASKKTIAFFSSEISGGYVGIDNNYLSSPVKIGATVDNPYTYSFTGNKYTGNGSHNSFVQAQNCQGIIGNNHSSTNGIKQNNNGYNYEYSDFPGNIDNTFFVGTKEYVVGPIDLSGSDPFKQIVPVSFTFSWVSVEVVYSEGSSVDSGVVVWVGMVGDSNQNFSSETSDFKRLVFITEGQLPAGSKKIYRREIENQGVCQSGGAPNIGVYCPCNKNGTGEVYLTLTVLPNTHGGYIQ